MSEIRIKEAMEEIYHKLQYENTRLNEEQTETYKEVLQKLWKNTEDEVPFELGNIDTEIVSMLGFFENAIIRGNSKTANQVLAAATESIRFARIPVAGATEQEQEKIRQKREQNLHTLNLLLKFQDYYDELKIKIDKMQEQQAEYQTEIQLAQKETEAYEDEKSYYEQKVSRVISGKEKLTADTKKYINKMNRLADARNNYKKYSLLQQILTERSQTLLNSIHTINLIAFGSVEILGQETIEDLKNTMDQFEKNMAEQRKQNKELKAIVNRMDDILDSAADMAAADSGLRSEELEELAADQKRWKQMNMTRNEMERGQKNVEMYTL
ncbi:MAG: hypothetical protein PUC51_09780 [Ruminococcus sp.]|nr:hypothetical protein [Ruminococcus sp.]